jgi:uncharacterized damage-inducible protein DinB
MSWDRIECRQERSRSDVVNADLIDQYAAGGGKLRPAIAGLSQQDLLARPGPGAWSIHELVIHVVDSDFVGADRMKRVIAESNPPLIGFDENLWIEHLSPQEQSLEDALTMFEAGRRQMTRILRQLPAAAFARTGQHSERGPLTLENLVQTFVTHVDHHLRFLQEKRQRLGKPLS